MSETKKVSSLSLKTQPVSVRYVADVRVLEIEFENGISYRYPVSRLNFNRWDGNAYVPLTPAPTDADLQAVELWPSGEIIEFETISQSFQVSQLIGEIFG
ncbi:MAG: hypothetical protein AAGL17_14705 [Cyanobacteria bacterium J06576_12]